MKKSISINIRGILFNIDEDAYLILKNYLDDISVHFSNSSQKEIMEDIESRIAEIFQEKRKDKEVISIDDVKELIKTMGQPSDFADPEMTENNAEETQKKPKRFYRNPDEKIIAGISSGLAAYFSMEIWITRLLIILISIIITPPAAILIYILLWIIVPEAKTTAQKLEMKGENITVSNIEKTIKEEVNNVKNNFKRFAKSDSYKKAKTVINKSADATSVFLEAFGKIILAIIGIIFIIIGSISILSLGTILIFDFSVFPISFSEGSIFITQYAHLFASPTNATILLLGIFLITITPLFLLLFAGLKFTFNFKSNNKLILLISLFAWIIGIFITISFSLLEVRNYAIKENIRQGESTYSSKYTCFILETSSQNYNNNYLNILEKDNQRTLQIRPSIDIKRSYNDSIQVIVTKKSRGRNKRNADNNAKQLIYNWEIKDSVIIFDPYFQIQAGNQWRFSEIDIIVKIPKDQKIYISENTEELLENISNNRNYQKNRMGNKFWRMKNDELHYVKKP